VPCVGADAAVRFVEVPRRYQIPVSVRLRYGGEVHEERATIVLEKRGITRIHPGLAPERGPDPGEVVTPARRTSRGCA